MNGKLAVVGCGNWGKNLVRNFCQILGPDRVTCCDQREEVLQRVAAEYPGIGTLTDVGPIWSDSAVTCVAIATPALTHYSLAKEALLAGKHVFVEKPLTTSVAEAIALNRLAEQERKVLMVDHLLLFHPAVQELERVIGAGELGEMYHLYSQRTNLGIVRSEENVLWSLGPHDVAVMLRFGGQSPVQVVAQGGAYLQPRLGIHDVAFVTLVFPGGQVGHLHLSWHDPRKSREITVVGSRKTAVFDDLEQEEKLRIYEVGVQSASDGGAPTLHDGGIRAVPIARAEPLKLACQHFLDSIGGDAHAVSDGRMGLEVVQVLEAAQCSLDQGGRPVTLRETHAGV